MNDKKEAHLFTRVNLICLLVLACFVNSFAQQKLKVIVAGLNHDHVHNILHAYNDGKVSIIGIAEPDKSLWKKFGDQYHLPDSLF